jgi:Fe2+ transport system protein FeoA
MLVKKIEEMGFVEDCNFAVVGIVSVSLPGHNAYV